MTCEHCLSYPHKRGCPNEETRTVAACSRCGEPITTKESRVRLDGYVYHLDCFESISPIDILSLMGIEAELEEGE